MCLTYMILYTVDFIFSFVLGVIETWFYTSVSLVSLNVPMYSIMHLDGLTYSGGVMLLVNKICHIIDYKHVSFGGMQVLFANVECKLSIAAHKAVRFICVLAQI